jgi:hypothetical protein
MNDYRQTVELPRLRTMPIWRYLSSVNSQVYVFGTAIVMWGWEEHVVAFWVTSL